MGGDFLFSGKPRLLQFIFRKISHPIISGLSRGLSLVVLLDFEKSHSEVLTVLRLKELGGTMEGVLFWEVDVEEVEKLALNVSCHILAEW